MEEKANAGEGERERLRREKEERSRRYGIAPKEGTPLTPPADYPSDPDQYGDPVNYKYPIDEEHIRAAIAYFNREGMRESGGYTTEEWAIIGRRIARAASRLLGVEYEYRDGRVVRREEKSLAVKVLDDTGDTLKVAGWGVVFGGQDLEGDTFTPDTDFWLDRPEGPRPVLYDHSFNAPGLTVLGYAKATKTDDGLWVEAELDRHNQYVRMLERLIRAGVLGWSSGAVAHLVRRDGNRIVSWPIAEFSLTPTPAEPRTLGISVVRSLADTQPALKALLEGDGEASLADAGAQGSNLSEISGGETMELNYDEIAAEVVKRLSGLVESKPAGVAVPEPGADAVKSFNVWLRTGKGYKAAMSEGSGSAGGYLVPPEYHRELVTALADQSLLRKAGARVIRVSTNQVYVPQLGFGSAASIVSESGAYAEVEPTVAQKAVTLYKLGRLAKASEELVADAMVDIWRDVLLPDFTQAFAAAENSYFTAGTGSGQPEGFLTGGTQGVVTASSTEFTVDEVVALYHSLPYLYRENAVWMMHDTTAMLLRQMKDSQGRSLWQPSLSERYPDTLLGRPVITNNWMPTVGAGAKVIAFGDFRYYWIFETGDMTVQRLDELYAANGQIGFRAFRRVGGAVVLPAAIVYLQLKSS